MCLAVNLASMAHADHVYHEFSVNQVAHYTKFTNTVTPCMRITLLIFTDGLIGVHSVHAGLFAIPVVRAWFFFGNRLVPCGGVLPHGQPFVAVNAFRGGRWLWGARAARHHPLLRRHAHGPALTMLCNSEVCSSGGVPQLVVKFSAWQL